MKNLIKLEENPNVLLVNNVYNFLDPEVIYLPFEGEIDKDTYVYKNTYLKSNVASISGRLKKSQKKIFDGKWRNCYQVVNDYKENFKLRNQVRNIKNKEELMRLLARYHLESIQNKIEGIDVKNLLVSCFDEEIYELNEFMCLSENYKEILKTIDDLRKIFNLEGSTLGIKSTNAKSIKNVKSILGTYPNINLKLLPDKYLMSRKENICEFLDLKEDETLLLKSEEVYFIYNILKGKDIVEKYITVSGDNLEKSIVIKTKLGVSLKEIIAKFLSLKDKECDIYYNGVLKGDKINKQDIIITLNTDCLVLNEKSKEAEGECINCGACQKICPHNINVKKCYFENLRSKKCINCGLCNYVCPANLSLKEKVRGDIDEKDE